MFWFWYLFVLLDKEKYSWRAGTGTVSGCQHSYRPSRLGCSGSVVRFDRSYCVPERQWTQGHFSCSISNPEGGELSSCHHYTWQDVSGIFTVHCPMLCWHTDFVAGICAHPMAAGQLKGRQPKTTFGHISGSTSSWNVHHHAAWSQFGNRKHKSWYKIANKWVWRYWWQ